ncbi:MAG: phosphodiesterase [Peptococcaceae bacterium BRH_c8a]|nr:MAG: phosphodiesterase [Peptococcaceae bacterium BRH_c8a]
MRKVSVDRLKSGMKVGRSVINTNGQILLAHGIILNEKFIKRLAHLGIPAVYIDDGFLSDIQVEDVVSERTRYQAIELTKKVFQDFQYTRSLTGLEKVENAVGVLIKELLDNDTLMVNLVDIRGLDEYTFGHSVNTCILAVITAIHMGYNEKKLHLLAMGAILHDLGKILVPQEILNKPGKLTDEEFEVIKTHSEFGYRLLSANKDFNSISSTVAWQHHERYNGSGYPQGLAGNRIHEFSFIVGVADVYDALTADRVYRKAHPPHEAFEMLSGTGDYLFDYEVVKAFLYHVAAYPVGSLVRLNNRQTGVVLENRPGYPLRPKLKILFNVQDEPELNPYELDLGVHPNFSIINVIEEDDVLDVYKKKICT